VNSRDSSAILFEDVSKQFTLRRERPRSFQELFLFWRHYRRKKPEKFWVLQNIDFHVAPGETVGIIGPNGAGKSTVLKLIAGIIAPTSGRVAVNGRVSSLIELGAGFHPDLTGRENIFLYGSLLGLHRGTMQRRFDAIVDFSGLESFIDLPVRTYSSGMYLRLAFAVAINVDPDVLLIDEILAVGDQAFQRKCLERIAALQNQQVSILFVSHSLDSVRQLCSRALWMEDGGIQATGATETVVQRYLDAVAQAEDAKLGARNRDASSRNPRASERGQGETQSTRWGRGDIEITAVRMLNCEGQERYVFQTHEPVTIQIHYRASSPVDHPVFGLALHRSDGFHITGPNSEFGGLEIPRVHGEGVIEYQIPRLMLLPGSYQITAAVHDALDTQMYDYHDRLYSFQIQAGGTREQYGLISLGGEWRHINAR
jgi:lipopolysaccharide transport system ATP-binding protein